MSKKALIITDGTESIKTIAGCICNALKDFNVKTCSAENFEGTDLLPVDVFFLGCEKPSPLSFSYLEDMLSHINLSSRKCGVFSVNEEPITYLCKIVEDCEAHLGSPLHITSEKIPESELEKWVSSIVSP